MRRERAIESIPRLKFSSALTWSRLSRFEIDAYCFYGGQLIFFLGITILLTIRDETGKEIHFFRFATDA